MSPATLKWIIVFSALMNYGFMAFDGMRALIKGDYIRPKNGKHAGQLGPWSRLVRLAGINPEADPMKWVFVLLGSTGLLLNACFAFDTPWSPEAMFILSLSSLWYMVPGTVLSILQIVCLAGIAYS